MARVTANVISPRLDPFPLDEMTRFWEDDTISVGAFSTGIDKRDGRECIVEGCGYNLTKCLDYCHIIGRTEDEEWEDLQEWGYIPKTKLRKVVSYARNGLLMCKSHHALFDHHYFFFRYRPEACHLLNPAVNNPKDEKYYFINATYQPCLTQFHGLPARLDPSHPFAPHPNLLLHHENSLRGRRNKNREVYLLTNVTPASVSSMSTSLQPSIFHTSPRGTSPRLSRTSLATSPIQLSPDRSPSPERMQTDPRPPKNQSMDHDGHIASKKGICTEDLASLLFGHWETSAIKKLVLADMSTSDSDGRDELWEPEWESEEVETEQVPCVASSRVKEKVESWLLSIVDTPQKIAQSESSQECSL